MARRSDSSSSGGGFVDQVSVASAHSMAAPSGAKPRRGRLAVDDRAEGGPVTVTVIDRDEIPRMTGKGRYRIG